MAQRVCLALLILVLGLASMAWAQAEEEVARVIAERIKAFNEGNLQGFMATWADNAVWTPAGSPFRVEGKEAIQRAYAGFFQSFPTRVYVPRQRSIRVYGTTVVSNTYFTLTLVDRAGKATTQHGRLSVTFVKLGDRWLSVDQHVSLVPPSP